MGLKSAGKKYTKICTIAEILTKFRRVKQCLKIRAEPGLEIHSIESLFLRNLPCSK
jgi:hypothetical protein